MMWFHNMNIGRKLILGFLVVAALAGIVGLKGILSLKAQSASAMRTYAHVTVPIAELTGLNVAFLRQRTDALQMAMTTDDAWREDRIKKVQARSGDVEKFAAALSASIIDDSVRTAFEEFQRLRGDYALLMQHLVELSQEKKTEEAVAFFNGDMDKARYKVIAVLEKMTEMQIRQAKLKADENDAQADSGLWIMLGVVMAAIGMAVGLGYYLSHHLAHPVRILFGAATELSQGNLNVTVQTEANDEIGRLSRVFNEMASNLRHSREELVREKAGVEKKVEDAIAQSTGEQRYLRASIDTLLAGMERFADGDLTVNVKAQRNDEIGRLFDGFNHAVERIHELLSGVTEATIALASATEEISSSTEEMAAGAHEQTQQAAEVSSAIDEMTKTIMDTSKNASLAAETAKHAGDNAKVGGQVVMDTIGGMNRIAEVVKQSARTVEALGKSSDQVGEIVQTIDDIADQTNLLALNAAIEAARAGEQGRGFAVVADEVRKLAERTTKATKEIAGMIRQIQKDTAEAVDSMHTGTEEVEKGKTMADQAGESLKEIITGAEKVVDVATQVAAASEEQSSAAEQIGKNIEAITNVTAESAAGTQQIAHAADDLNRLTSNLQQMLNKFSLVGADETRHHHNRLR